MNYSYLPDEFLLTNTDLDAENYNAIYVEPTKTQPIVEDKKQDVKVIERMSEHMPPYHPTPSKQIIVKEKFMPCSCSKCMYNSYSPDISLTYNRTNVLLFILIVICLCILNIVKDIRMYHLRSISQSST